MAGRSALKEYLKTSNISIFTQGALTLELDRMISASELYDFALQKCIRFNLNPGHDWSPLMGKVSPRDRSQAREIMTSITQVRLSCRASALLLIVRLRSASEALKRDSLVSSRFL